MLVLTRFLAVALGTAVLLLAPSAAPEERAISDTLQSRLKWRYEMRAPTFWPAVDDLGNVYLHSSGLLECVGADGKSRWIIGTFASGGYYGGPPAIGKNGTVYCLGHLTDDPTVDRPDPYDEERKGVFFAINAERQFVLWMQAEGPLCSWPVVDAKGVAYCTLDGIGLVAIDPEDYSTLWIYDTGEGNYASDLPKISVDENGVVYAGLDVKVHAVSPTGKALWVRDLRFPWDFEVPLETKYREEAGNWQPPPCGRGLQLGVYLGQSVYVANAPCILVGLDYAGEVLWRKDIMSSRFLRPPTIGADGELYVVDPADKTWRIDGAGDTQPLFSVRDMRRTYPGGSYEEMWRTVDRQQLIDQLHVEARIRADASGPVYIGALDTVWALEQDGSIRWIVELPADFANMTTYDAGGMLYVTCDDGCLYAIDTA